MDDGFYMRRCVELARKAIGFTSPNPMVGCVIVKDGEIVGEGFHPKAGQPHAEVFALSEAGNLAENATAYVSLEPCNHHGRTPPCTEALIRAKVKQVVVGMVDPNPIVASKGVERLKESGIDVVVGVEELLCQKLNEAYIHRMRTGNPFVVLRYSLTMNGRISSHLGKAAHEPGGYYSKLLQEYDGILVSGDCLSRTTSAETGANQPLQIIIANNMNSLHLPITTIESASRTILDHCRYLGLCSIVVDLREEHGAITEVLGGCLEEGLVQKAVVEVCPVWDESREEYLPSVGVETRILKDLRSYVTNGSVLIEGYVS
ncbi:hypothetical protein HPP92_014015 [Vanilla planifolia]|uniref:Riboflavin biosynthesis protein PYRD, chloroplastic n=1 Tax=Vanilla planifolia TaxID=51239 RepID=A0A835UVB1_VANPL|nr:hypothetical protein HPP92_014015 [Vanilla planifolia]